MSKLSTTQLNTPTSGKVLISDGSGNITTSSTTSTELGHLAGVTSAIQTQINSKTDATDLGANNGIATLDAGGKIPASQLPNTVMEFKGQYNATTNSPTLVDGTGNAGDVYRVNVAGSQDFGSGTITFAVGDWVMYSGTVWQQSSNSNTVVSVNGQQGTVVLSSTDISEGTNLYFTTERAQDATGAMATSSSKVSLTYNDGANTLTPDIVTGSLVNADINASAGIDVVKLADGSVSNTEFLYLDGVTSAIQTQLNGKEPTITTLSITKGGTNSGTALNNNRVIQSSGGALVEAAAITANRALISDANGIPTQSATTSTELGHVSGVTSAIQTQLGNKADLGANTFTGRQSAPQFRGTPQSSDPGSPVQGVFYYSDGTPRAAGLWQYDGSAWQPVGANAGFIATDWQNFPSTAYGTLWSSTGTAGAYGTIATHIAKYRRVGSNMEISIDYRQTAAGTAGTGALLLSLPAGYSIDTSAKPANTTVTYGPANIESIVGTFALKISTANFTIGHLIPYDSTKLKIQFAGLGTTPAIAVGYFGGSGTYDFATSAGLSFNITASIPIQGWAANTVAAVQSINARAHNSATSISGTPATIVWTTEDYDTDSALASGVFTVPSTGKYHVDTALGISGTFVLNTTSILDLQVNGTSKANVTRYIAAAVTNDDIQLSTDLQLTAGDTVRVQYSNSGTTPAIVNSDTRNFFSISKIGN